MIPVSTNSSAQKYESIEKYDAAHAPAGLIRRYARGRARTIWLRLGVAIMGCALLALMVSPGFGLMVAFITLPLEILEFWILKRWVITRAAHQNPVYSIVTFASTLQAVGIGPSIFFTGTQSTDLRMVAWAFLLGSVLNSMLAAQYHPASNLARSWVLCSAAVIVLVDGFGRGHISTAQFWAETGALVAMGLMLWHLFSHLARRDARVQTAERELIHRSVEAERLALVAEHASDSILLMDSNLIIQWVNPQFTKVTGYSADYAIGRTPSAFLNHADTSEESIARLIKAARNKTSVNLRILNQTKDGRAIWVETHQAPVIDEHGEIKAFIAVEREATALVAREKQLQHALIAAKEADREKVAFLSRMSHELRTPANGIIGGLDLLRETQIDESQQEALSILDISSKRLKALSDNLIGAGLETETTQTQFSEMQIADVIDEIVAQHKPTAKDKGVTLSAEVAPSARAMMRTDASVIHGVLDKLVDNAVKFTPKGHVHIEARLEEDSWLHIIVEDTSVGIPNEKLSQIFEAFEQVDDHDTRNFDGAGLGLATAKTLAGLLGGRVRVNSTLGQGSRFKIKIPVQVVAGAAPFENGQHVVADGVKTPVLMGTAEEVGIKKSKAPEQMRLLVAEDNRANRMLIKTMLKSVGHTIDFAEDGVQAVERYTKNRPDFVLMDLSMPNKNGFDATREIRELERKDSLRRCPIVAVTANVTEDDRRKCFDAGMDAFLPKPVKKAKLLETITEVSA